MDQFCTHAHVSLLVNDSLSLLLEVELAKRLARVEYIRCRQSLRDSTSLLRVGARLVSAELDRVISAMQGAGDANSVRFSTVAYHVILVTLAHITS